MTPTLTLAPSLPLNLASQLQRAERRKKVFAISLTLPLLLFLLATFIIPIGALLTRAVENPEVASTLGLTAQALNQWDRNSAPPDAAYSALIEDLSASEPLDWRREEAYEIPDKSAVKPADWEVNKKHT